MRPHRGEPRLYMGPTHLRRFIWGTVWTFSVCDGILWLDCGLENRSAICIRTHSSIFLASRSHARSQPFAFATVATATVRILSGLLKKADGHRATVDGKRRSTRKMQPTRIHLPQWARRVMHSISSNRRDNIEIKTSGAVDKKPLKSLMREQEPLPNTWRTKVLVIYWDSLDKMSRVEVT